MFLELQTTDNTVRGGGTTSYRYRQTKYNRHMSANTNTDRQQTVSGGRDNLLELHVGKYEYRKTTDNRHTAVSGGRDNL